MTAPIRYIDGIPQPNALVSSRPGTDCTVHRERLFIEIQYITMALKLTLSTNLLWSLESIKSFLYGHGIYSGQKGQNV